MLVVDDEPILRAVLMRLLRSDGYSVVEASDGPDALAVFERHPDVIPLVLIDLHMPGADGVRTAEALKRMNPDVSIIYMSGKLDQRALALGPRECFLEKPFGMAQLTSLVELRLASA